MSSEAMLLVFGGAAMVVLSVVQALRVQRGGTLGTNYVKGYGLILVATLGATLTVMGGDSSAKAPAYTLLGTVAGYLAASGRPQSAPTGRAQVPGATESLASGSGQDSGASAATIRAESSL